MTKSRDGCGDVGNHQLSPEDSAAASLMRRRHAHPGPVRLVWHRERTGLDGPAGNRANPPTYPRFRRRDPRRPGRAQGTGRARSHRARLLNALDESFRRLDIREPCDCAQDKPIGDGFYDSVVVAQQTLDEGLAAAGPPLSVDIIAVGHAHLDVAWLWPVSQTRRKAARTFSSVLRLMEQFPDFHFAQSQPQLYRVPYESSGFSLLFWGWKRRVRGELISSNTIPVFNQVNPGSNPTFL